MAQADLGKVRLTDAELSEKIIQVNGGIRFGKDAEGKPGYVVTDAETGADAVIPFKCGGSSGIILPYIVNLDFGGTYIHFVNNGSSPIAGTKYILPELIKITDIKNIKVTITETSLYNISPTNGINYRECYLVLGAEFPDFPTLKEYRKDVYRISGNTQHSNKEFSVEIQGTEMTNVSQITSIGASLRCYNSYNNACKVSWNKFLMECKIS